MKLISENAFAKEAMALLNVAQQERVVVTRRGKPVAVLVGIENCDEEDYALARDVEFWRMIEQRRKQKTIPLAEVERRLGLRATRRNKASTTAAGVRKH